ncbi:MAG: DNA translocase FtsK [Candidatus Liptonbacteria bacterium]|nr:DNA translocase FtsK [Candidatus Liptonbacteria bacterium]
MARRRKKGWFSGEEGILPRLKAETKRSVWGIVLLGIATLLVLAGVGRAGPLGETIFRALSALLGWGYLILPISLVVISGIFLFSEREHVMGVTATGALLLTLSALGLIDLLLPQQGGWLGLLLGSLEKPFGKPAAVIVNAVVFLAAVLITFDVPLKLKLPRKENGKDREEHEEEPNVTGEAAEEGEEEREGEETETQKAEEEEPRPRFTLIGRKRAAARRFGNYVAPPPSLLKSASERPTTGDLRANANIIRRTMESFGIAVDMGEVNIGPKVTRYTLKPAEGVKLTRITALHQDIALALAAHPIRIEAPIPGKSLVGIEVPNKTAALVRLGSLLAYDDFAKAGPLAFALGRDVMGEPLFPDIERMPHLLVAGATGSGKSVTMHSLIISLLYKNSPQMLKFVMIDPKRVELTAYADIPHLVTPVITDSKKAIHAFRWAIKEMERRYELLEEAGSRDIKSYNARLLSPERSNGGQASVSNQEAEGERKPLLPYLVIAIDELADLMTSYGREVEGSVVRLAQMARATGIHLVLSTQRPSVEIITGLIKANITNRIALQVASQVDSRTILDAAGAEKLLGGGDLLFLSPESTKPKRFQGAYLTEEEVRKVADFIREHNPVEIGEEEAAEGETPPGGEFPFQEAEEAEDDEFFSDALRVVHAAGKASASLLQRRLKVGYARAARLLDLMEEKGYIGPGEGAKPRELYPERFPERRD